MTSFVEIAQDVYVLRYPVLDVNVGLIVGAGAALVVDTLSTEAQANELVDAARQVATVPLYAVNTHHHFDHCFGNAVLAALGAPIWAHEETARLLRERGPALRREAYQTWGTRLPALAPGLAAATVRPPDRTVVSEATVDLGGRAVVLRHPGRGHTAGDLAVVVPDAGTLFAGDLIEESGPPQFDDGYPVEWPDAVAALLALAPPDATVVPGHGRVVGRGFVQEQHADLANLAWLIRDGHADGAPVDAVAAHAAFDRRTSQVAVRRGYAELSGDLD